MTEARKVHGFENLVSTEPPSGQIGPITTISLSRLERVKMALVYQVDWIADATTTKADTAIVEAAAHSAWIYSERVSDWIHRLKHCLRLAPTSAVVVGRFLMPLADLEALSPDDPPVPISRGQSGRQLRRARRRARKRDERAGREPHA